MSEATDEPLLTPEEAAAYLKVRPDWLRRHRLNCTGPPFIPLSSCRVRYSKTALASWAHSLAVQGARAEAA